MTQRHHLVWYQMTWLCLPSQHLLEQKICQIWLENIHAFIHKCSVLYLILLIFAANPKTSNSLFSLLWSPSIRETQIPHFQTYTFSRSICRGRSKSAARKQKPPITMNHSRMKKFSLTLVYYWASSLAFISQYGLSQVLIAPVCCGAFAELAADILGEWAGGVGGITPETHKYITSNFPQSVSGTITVGSAVRTRQRL